MVNRTALEIPPAWDLVSVPSLLKLFNIDYLDVLKMDCEGCEYSLADDVGRDDPDFWSKIGQFHVEIHTPKKWIRDHAHAMGLGRLLHQLKANNFVMASYSGGQVSPYDTASGCLQEMSDYGWPCTIETSRLNLGFIRREKNPEITQIQYSDPKLVAVSDPRLVVVTGSSSNHFSVMTKFLLPSLREYLNPVESKVIVYDLGLSEPESQTLTKEFPALELRVFNFSSYPSFFDINVSAGEYAWKPVIIHSVIQSHRQSTVLWMDAGDALVGNLANAMAQMRSSGAVSTCTSGSVSDWVHAGTTQAMKLQPGQYADRPMSNAAFVGFDASNTTIVGLVQKWYECALDRECIAPLGSSRVNHRQDQAVLTLLFLMYNITYDYSYQFLDFQQHLDENV